MCTVNILIYTTENLSQCLPYLFHGSRNLGRNLPMSQLPKSRNCMVNSSDNRILSRFKVKFRTWILTFLHQPWASSGAGFTRIIQTLRPRYISEGISNTFLTQKAGLSGFFIGQNQYKPRKPMAFLLIFTAPTSRLATRRRFASAPQCHRLVLRGSCMRSSRIAHGAVPAAAMGWWNRSATKAHGCGWAVCTELVD